MKHINSRHDFNWLRKASDDEAAHRSVCVGGLASRLGVLQPAEKGPEVFGQFVEFGRRRLRLTVEQLADRAAVDVEELVQIERGQCEAPSARTIHNLAQAFQLPTNALAEVAGLIQARNKRLDHAAYLFAARSEPTAMLNEAEEQAYQEFVKVIVESSISE
jgi:transcriptional regulator with XRE-family HTH domain